MCYGPSKPVRVNRMVIRFIYTTFIELSSQPFSSSNLCRLEIYGRYRSSFACRRRFVMTQPQCHPKEYKDMVVKHKLNHACSGRK